MSIGRFLMAVGIMVVLAPSWAYSQPAVPQVVRVQGFLVDNADQPMDGTVSMAFELYDDPVAGLLIRRVDLTSVLVRAGLYEAELPLSSADFSGQARYLQVSVNGEVLSPRLRVASAPFAYVAERLEGVRASELVRTSELGAHVTNPDAHREHASLEESEEIVDSISDHSLQGDPHAAYVKKIGDTITGRLEIIGTLGVSGTSSPAFSLRGSGSQLPDYDGDTIVERGVVIGSVDSNRTSLRFRATGTGAAGSGGIRWGYFDRDEFYLHRPLPSRNLKLDFIDFSASGGHSIANYLTVTEEGRVGIGTASPTARLHVEGRTKTQVLEITGGADLAEPFQMSSPNPLPAGAVVVIDEASHGRLRMSDAPYDRRVAGVISGAGGISPGLTLSSDDLEVDGQHVALTGRVYVLAAMSNGAIRPGDLLTTSGVPGHAMKATDVQASAGAIIGKALTALEAAQGLVLILVSLQ